MSSIGGAPGQLDEIDMKSKIESKHNVTRELTRWKVAGLLWRLWERR